MPNSIRSRAIGAAAWLLPRIVLVVAAVASPGCPCIRGDPADVAADPGEFRGDQYDRRTAGAVEHARGARIGGMLLDSRRDQDVVSCLFESRGRQRADVEGDTGLHSNATHILLARRAHATYVVAVRAMEHPDPSARHWGLRAVEIVEGRRVGASADHPGPAYRGPERDKAISMVGRLCLADPDPQVRTDALFLAHRRFPKAGRPSTEAVVAALKTETKAENREFMLLLLSERRAPAETLLDAAVRGFKEPGTMCLVIKDALTEENAALISSAFDRGDAVGRASLGWAFNYVGTKFPWAESIIFKGLSDPDPTVREQFAKGAIVIRPPSPRVRSALESLRGETMCAGWALSFMDGESQDDAGTGD